MSALFDARDSGNRARRNIAPGPPATLGETALSAWEHVTSNMMTISEDMLLRAEYERYLERVEEVTGETFDNPLDAPRVPEQPVLEETNPALERFLAEQPDRPRLSIARPRAQFRQKTPRERARDLFVELTRLKVEKFPELRVRTPEDIEAAIGRRRAKARARRADVAAREGALGSVVAFAIETGVMLLDPPVLASMAFGAPWATGILRGALIDAGIGAAVEVPIQASLQATRARLGERTSLSEAAFNVLSVGAGGFLFSGLIRGGVKGTRGVVRTVRDRRLARTRAERDALAFMERQIDLEDATPFDRDRPAARAEHETRLSEAQLAVREGRAPRQEEPRAPLRRELTDEPAVERGADPGPGGVLRETFSFEEGPLHDFEQALKTNGARRREQVRADITQREAAKRLATFVRASPGDEDLTAFIDMLRRPPKPPRVTSLTQFLKDKGGLKDTGGELKALGITPRTRPGLINNKTGRDLDEAALIATEAGFFGGQGLGDQLGRFGRERATVGELLDALADDFSGRTRRFDIEDEQLLAEFEAISRNVDEILRDLDEVGIDLTKLSDQEALAALRQVAARAARRDAPSPGTRRATAAAAAERSGLEAFEEQGEAFDRALERQVRDDFAERGDERIFIETEDGEITRRTAAEILNDIDQDNVLRREFRECIGA